MPARDRGVDTSRRARTIPLGLPLQEGEERAESERDLALGRGLRGGKRDCAARGAEPVGGRGSR